MSIKRLVLDAVPATLEENTQAFVTEDGETRVYIGDSNNLPVAVLPGTKTYAVTSIDDSDSPFTATVGAQTTVIIVDASSDPVNISLPTAVGISGKRFTFKKVDDSANAVTVDGDGAETIDGVPQRSIEEEFETFTVVSDGANWHVVVHSFGSDFLT